MSWFFHWVPRRTAALHPPVIEMLGRSESALRQGFACGKTLVTRHPARPPKGGIYSVVILHVAASAISLAAAFFKSRRALILLRLLSESNPLCWASIRVEKRNYPE